MFGCPHRGLDLTTVHCHNRLEWANAHIRWRLELWRGVLFMDKSWFSLYRAYGRHHVWCRVGECGGVLSSQYLDMPHL